MKKAEKKSTVPGSHILSFVAILVQQNLFYYTNTLTVIIQL